MKARRQSRILELVREHLIETQEDLAARLHREGFPVTQATVSRDVKELKLAKVPVGDGRSRYAASGEAPPPQGERMLRLFRDCVTGYDASENVVVINTIAATASGVAEAVDGLRAPEVIGTLAGERTVFVVIKPKRAVPGFLGRLDDILGGHRRR